MKNGLFCFVIAQLISHSISAAAAPQSAAIQDMVLIPGGQYIPFVIQRGDKSKPKIEEKQKLVIVHDFWMDRYPASNQDFLNFVKSNPEWRKSSVKPVFADAHYLADWKSDLSVQQQKKRSPVTHISWFAAQAYCESLGKELPTTDQWEYVLADQGRDQTMLKEKILAWYGKPHAQTLPMVGGESPNGFGVYDLAGLIWEWTQDFNDLMVGQESRDNGGKDSNLFCGGGSQITNDSANYAAFMRFSFRSSLKAPFTTGDLGFRCAKDVP